MPNPRPARPAPDPEDDDPETLAALRAELADRMAHHRAALERVRARPRPWWVDPA
jgi:hypothetical protein